MSDEKKHTALPWGFGKTSDDQRIILGDNGNGRYVAHVQIYQTPRTMGLSDEAEREANAALIVRAVNCHDELVKALDWALRRVAMNGLVVDPGSLDHAKAILARAKEPRP